jgi:small subunit ribosomal protein S21
MCFRRDDFGVVRQQFQKWIWASAKAFCRLTWPCGSGHVACTEPYRRDEQTCSSEAGKKVAVALSSHSQRDCCAIGLRAGSPDFAAPRGVSMQVFVRDNNVEQALRVLKKKMQREGVFREMKQRRDYEKPSERKAREKSDAIRRARKLARKQAIKEGLLPAPPKKKLPERKPPLPQTFRPAA